MKQKYTINTIKEYLPPVKVDLGKAWGIKECPVAGKKEKFAGILLPLGIAEISWECYLRCVNNNIPVKGLGK